MLCNIEKSRCRSSRSSCRHLNCQRSWKGQLTIKGHQPSSDGLHASSDGLQPTSNGLQPTSTLETSLDMQQSAEVGNHTLIQPLATGGSDARRNHMGSRCKACFSRSSELPSLTCDNPLGSELQASLWFAAEVHAHMWTDFSLFRRHRGYLFHDLFWTSSPAGQR